MGIKIKLNLIDFRGCGNFAEHGQHFLVESLTNCIDFVAGQYLSEERVREILTYESRCEIKIRMPKKSDL